VVTESYSSLPLQLILLSVFFTPLEGLKCLLLVLSTAEGHFQCQLTMRTPQYFWQSNTYLFPWWSQSSVVGKTVSWKCLWGWIWTSCGMGYSLCLHHPFVPQTFQPLSWGLLDLGPIVTFDYDGITWDSIGEGQGLQEIHQAMSRLLKLHLEQGMWRQEESFPSFASSHNLHMDLCVTMGTQLWGDVSKHRRAKSIIFLTTALPSPEISALWGENSELPQTGRRS
jgi:hypothetical protein